MAYLLKFLDIFRWKKHYGREWGIQKIFMDFIKERMNRIMSKVYIFFADGFEDIEGLTVVDLMRRAGIDIQTESIKETKEIRTSHGISGACSGRWKCNYQQRPWNSHRFQPFPDRTAGGKRKGRRDR